MLTPVLMVLLKSVHTHCMIIEIETLIADSNFYFVHAHYYTDISFIDFTISI